MKLIWTILAIYLKQGIKVANYTKLLLFMWILMTIVLDACYLGEIYSLIRVPIEYRIETLDELIKNQNNGNIKIVVHNGTVQQHILIRNFVLL